jgi:hypothetical protein
MDGELNEHNCPANTFCLGGVKQKCTAGTYQDQVGQAFCKPVLSCSPGKFDRSQGANLLPNRCETCPAGYFAQDDHVLKCMQCPLGKFQNFGGKAYCDETKSDSVMKAVQTENGTTMVQWRCVTGIRCNGKTREYQGGVWHDPAKPFPEQSNMYTCVNDGCPIKGATEMKCKEGYKPLSPLCAVCAKGYYEQLGGCVECSEPNVKAFFGFIVGFIFFMVLVMLCLRHQRTFLTTEIVANVKIAVSFLTIVSTINTQVAIAMT